ncbi:hypothetical protein DN752_00550 [Echinicola strongylocentroti]|uniref:NIPSNAP domain-containing protein n=1 Tax=Echinicola strongylocentroti TaxID=1795355 RepID=A0A2Z4ID04_9BACT|nr:NIPSNAP family protein [Echinicola strongylocentroti]AWW28744.1 hypothetical protein DN752_00550 [Echinicola strongylocentroti]
MKQKVTLLLIMIFLGSMSYVFSQSQDIFEIKIYHFSTAEQASKTNQFLEESYIPAMHRKGIQHIGVYEPLETDSLAGKRIYVFTPYPSANSYMDISSTLHLEDLPKGKHYQKATHDAPPYDRMEAILLKAFSGMPHYDIPNLEGDQEERIYELRSYESPTEQLFHNKVSMFNNGEIDIFDRLDFNAVFYGEVIAGPNMPNLMYMTSFTNMDAEKSAWKAFGADPAWIELRDDKAYQNNVSHIDIMLLRPLEYSEL